MRLGLKNNSHINENDKSFYENGDSDNYFNSNYNLSFLSNRNDYDDSNRQSENTRLLSSDEN
jgi:hypothetical protein